MSHESEDRISKMFAIDKSALGQALSYCINQEQYLRVFLDNGSVPMDNNAALYTGYFYPHLFIKVA